MLRQPLLREILHPLLFRRIALQRGIEDLLRDLLRLGALSVVGERVGEVELRAQVLRMLLDRRGKDPDRFADVSFGPGQLVEVPAPDDLRAAVQEILVDLERPLDPIAELALEALAERGEDPYALRVEAEAGAGEIVSPHVVRLRRDSLVASFPGQLSKLRLELAAVGGAVGLPDEQRGTSPVPVERVGILRELRLCHAGERVLGVGGFAVRPQLVPALRERLFLRVHGARRTDAGDEYCDSHWSPVDYGGRITAASGRSRPFRFRFTFTTAGVREPEPERARERFFLIINSSSGIADPTRRRAAGGRPPRAAPRDRPRSARGRNPALARIPPSRNPSGSRPARPPERRGGRGGAARRGFPRSPPAAGADRSRRRSRCSR